MSKAAHESLIACQEILKSKLEQSRGNTTHTGRSSGLYRSTESPIMGTDFSCNFLDGQEFDFSGSEVDMFQALGDSMLREPDSFDHL